MSTKWLRLGLLVAILMVIGLLPGAPPATLAQSGGSISYGAKVFGALSADAPRLTYSFPGAAGDVVTAVVENWTGALELRAELVAPNGLVLGSSGQNTLDDNPQGAYLAAVLPLDGIYLLRIAGEHDTTGDFALTLLGHPAPASTELVFGEPVDLTLTPAADPQLFWFEAQNCPTSLIVTDLSTGLPFTYPFALKVYDQRGQTVGLLRGGEEQEGWITVAARSGRYEVEVTSEDLQQAGEVRLLVTCAADAAGCVAGAAGISGMVGSGPQECPSCFTPGRPPDEGACPDLHLTVEQDPGNPNHVRVSWDAMPGATGYAVYIFGSMGMGDEVYLTHAAWNPGDPTFFVWFLPDDYLSFRFVLRVYHGETVVCVQETGLEFEGPPPDEQLVCEPFTVFGELTDPAAREVTWTWTAYPDAVAYVFSYFEVLADDSEALHGALLIDAPQTSVTTILPAPSGPDVWRARVQVQLGSAFPCGGAATLEVSRQLHACGVFTVAVSVNTGTEATIIWSDYPGAEMYVISVYDGTHTMLPGYPQMVATVPLSYVLTEPPGDYFVEISPWFEATGAICGEEVAVTFTPDMMCDIRTDRRDVPMRYGPHVTYGVFGYLPPDTDVRVVGQALDADGVHWWQVDPAQYGGGAGVGGGLWVQSDLVDADPICGQVPGVQIPPPEQEQPPPGGEQPGGPGTWLPCGSCDSCGHPANECVTSPEGACLWDPATCQTVAGCAHINLRVNPDGSGDAGLLTAPNCDGGFTPGTSVGAWAKGRCTPTWSGCTGGSGIEIWFTASSSCTLTADFSACP